MALSGRVGERQGGVRGSIGPIGAGVNATAVRDRRAAVLAVTDLLDIAAVAPVGDAELRRALVVDLPDFQDAVQAACGARRAGRGGGGVGGGADGLIRWYRIQATEGLRPPGASAPRSNPTVLRSSSTSGHLMP